MLPVPPAGSATAIFDVPGEQSDLRVSPGLVVRRTSAGGRSIVEATLDPGSLTTVSWSARETGPAAPPRDTRLLADIKTLLTIGEADLRLLSLVDVTVVQGEPASITVHLPAGYELVGATGNTLDRTEAKGDTVVLFLAQPARRRHQFLLNLERSTMSAATGARASRLETGFPTVPASQRESGEVAIEGVGTLEISSQDIAGLKRMDVREVHASLSSIATQSLLSAFRYQRTASAPPVLTLNVTRFADAAVLAAIADRAVATTLEHAKVVHADRGLALHLRNRAQPFMKVVLPAGASMLTVDVAGPGQAGRRQRRCPCAAAQTRVPPRWHVYRLVRLPQRRNRVRQEGQHADDPSAHGLTRQRGRVGALPARRISCRPFWRQCDCGPHDRGLRGCGICGGNGWRVGVRASLAAAGAARQGDRKANEIVNRPADDASRRGGRDQDAVQQMAQEGAPSANVQLLQRRAAGVLPVRIDVPRAGTSHRFFKPLVVDEETVVTFRYQKR